MIRKKNTLNKVGIEGNFLNLSIIFLKLIFIGVQLLYNVA